MGKVTIKLNGIDTVFKKIKKSLVTVEVKNNKVIQSRIKNNDDPNKNQLAFLNEWEQKVLKGAA